MKQNQLAEAVRAGRSGNRAQMAQVLVDGKYVTFAAMAERTGREIVQCKHRYAHLKRKGTWPITWEMLK